MKSLQLPAVFSHYSVPKLDQNVYLLSEISDYSRFNLLPGEANVIFEEMYVGKTFIDPRQTSDSLKLSLGKDRKVTVNREKVADMSGTKFLSSKKEQTFTYDITVRNNKKEKISLLLKDQFPVSTDESMEIEWLEHSNGQVNKETGIVNWYLKLDPGESVKNV